MRGRMFLGGCSRVEYQQNFTEALVLLVWRFCFWDCSRVGRLVRFFLRGGVGTVVGLGGSRGYRTHCWVLRQQAPCWSLLVSPFLGVVLVGVVRGLLFRFPSLLINLLKPVYSGGLCVGVGLLFENCIVDASILKTKQFVI